MPTSFCDREKCHEYFGNAETIVVEENHMKYVVSNRARKQIAKFKVDDCLIDSTEERCDYLIIVCDEKKAYFVELKGKKVQKAISQIENTIRLLRPSLNGYQMNARIVATGVPKVLTTDIAKFKMKMREFRGDAKIATNTLNENL